MARSKDELKIYVAALAKEKNLTEDQTALAIAAATGDVESLTKEQIAQIITPLLDLAVGRQADYSRSMDEARTEKDRAIAHQRKLEQWRTQDVLPEITKLREKVTKFQDRYGDIDDIQDVGGGKSVTPSGEVVSTAKVNEIRSDIAKDFLTFESERSELSVEHFRHFKEPLDTRPLLDIIGKAANDPINPRQLGLKDAYTLLHGPKITEMAAAARADELAAARREGKEEGRKEARVQAAPRTGAAIPPQAPGTFWHHMNTGGGSNEANNTPQMSDAERAAMFTNDFRTRLAENEDDLEKAINQ